MEAARYLDSLNLNSNIECFILIEPGRGYIIPLLQEKFPKSKILVLHVDDIFPQEGIPALYSTEPAAIQEFLEKQIPEIDAHLIRIIEWRPSMFFYKETYVKLLTHVVEFIKRIDAGKRTTAAFGRRWVRNFFKNLNYLNNTALYKTTDIPVIITGSGPSLEAALPVIQNIKDNCLIIAASSSVMALANAGIPADIVIAADGGIWALQHIYPFFRYAAGCTDPNACLMAVNLCAALPSQCGNTPILVLNDGSFWQNIVLHELDIPSVIIPQRGTVTASAVDLAITLSSGGIYLAGMDLGVKDIRTHVRPYGFDHLLFNSASRIAPVYSKTFIRSGLISGGGSMDIYAAWFKNQLNLWPKRIFSLGSHEIFKDSFPFKNSAVKKKDGCFKTIRAGEDPAQFCKKGVSALLAALKDPRYAKNLKEELTPLFFPGRKEVTQQILKKAIYEASFG